MIVKIFFQIEVHNTNNKARIRLNDGFVGDITPHFPINRQGGVVVPNGWGPLCLFKKYKLTPK